MDIEKDLKFIERSGREKDDENWEFRSFLKRHDYEIEELDAIVHRINAEVCAQIDRLLILNYMVTSNHFLCEASHKA